DAARIVNALLQLVNTRWYAVWRAKARAMRSSVRGRSNETYSGDPAGTESRSSPSKKLDFDHWWLMSRPAQCWLPYEALASLLNTTVSCPVASAVSRAMSELMAVTGTWPFGAPSALRAKRH